jgi:hypothetical protein
VGVVEFLVPVVVIQASTCCGLAKTSDKLVAVIVMMSAIAARER